MKNELLGSVLDAEWDELSALNGLDSCERYELRRRERDDAEPICDAAAIVAARSGSTSQRWRSYNG